MKDLGRIKPLGVIIILSSIALAILGLMYLFYCLMWAGVGMMHRDNVSAFENFMLSVFPLIVIAIIIVFVVLAIKLGHRIATLKCKPTTLTITSIASLIVPITATAVITYLMRGSWAIFFVLIPSMPLIISSILALTRLSQYKTYYGKQKTSKKK